MRRFTFNNIPWVFFSVALATLLFQLNHSCQGTWQERLIYERAAIAQGEWWRIWSGHLVHFGWGHWIADAGLFIILGRLLEKSHPGFSRFALFTMPVVISGSLFFLDPAMTRYGGLSAINLGLLVWIACRGWQKNWIDWFWPAVLAVYVGEIILETTIGHGHGGGMIPFDDPTIRVATSAHIAGAVYGFLLWCIVRQKAGREVHRPTKGGVEELRSDL